jgi:hypothetical protein
MDAMGTRPTYMTGDEEPNFLDASHTSRLPYARSRRASRGTEHPRLGTVGGGRNAMSSSSSVVERVRAATRRKPSEEEGTEAAEAVSIDGLMTPAEDVRPRPSGGSDRVKVSMNFLRSDVSALRSWATADGTTMTDLVRRAVVLFQYLVAENRAGYEVVLRKRGKPDRIVVIEVAPGGARRSSY